MKAVCRLSDLSAGKLTAVLDGRVVVTLANGKPLATLARCPHQGADLSAGTVVDRVDSTPCGGLTTDSNRPVLRCPWHGFEYDLATGLPLAGEPAHRKMRLRTLAVHVQDDDVLIDI